MKFISFPAFFISLAIGIFFVYLTNPDQEIIYIYPTPDNISKVQYKDLANNCYTFTHTEVECPTNPDMIKKIPIQK